MSEVGGDSQAPALGEIAAATAGGAVGAVVAVYLGGTEGAAVGGAIAEGLPASLGALLVRRRRRAEHAIEQAARGSELTVEELLERLTLDDAGERLLGRVVRAAYDSGQADRLALLARKLGEGALADADGRERADAFVQALADLGTLHLSLLHSFERTSNELGLGDGSPEFDRVHGSLNRTQLEMVLPAMVESLDAVLAVALRHGLIEAHYPSGGMSFSSGVSTPSTPSFALTSFGRDLLAQLRAVSGALTDD